MHKKTFWNGEWENIGLIDENLYKVKKTHTKIQAISMIKEIRLPKSDEEILSYETSGLTKEDIDKKLFEQLKEIKSKIKMYYSFKDSLNMVSIEDYMIKENLVDNSFYSKQYTIYIRMELLDNLNCLFLNKKLKDKQVIKMGIDIISAFEEKEPEQLINFNIKPETIFFHDDIFKLGDFEPYAKSLELSIDHPTAIYSLGIILYQFFNNSLLPALDNEGNIPKPVNANEETSNIILKMCAYKNEECYQNVEDVKIDLERALNNLNDSHLLFKDDCEQEDKTISLFNKRTKLQVENILDTNEEDDYNRTVSLYRRKKVIQSKEKELDIQSKLKPEIISNKEMIEDERIILQSNYDYILTATDEDINQEVTKVLKINNGIYLKISLRKSLKNKEIFKIKQDNAIKKILLLMTNEDLNKQICQKKVKINTDEGNYGCIKTIYYHKKKYIVQIPVFPERKKLFLVEDSDIIFKLLVEKKDIKYYLTYILNFMFIILTCITSFLITSNIIITIICTLIISYLVNLFIISKINKKW